MPLNIKAFIKRARDYVALEGNTKVLSARFVDRFRIFGYEDVVILVKTSEKKEPYWWVVGGGTPMNLYSKKQLPTADEAFSFHTGISMRLLARDYKHSQKPPKNVGYDAFISHATEDKAAIVRPLAKQLTNMGFYVWYDEFELKVGDSLRQSIDKGLINSSYGIVILSPAFFSKNWPQYELNGLTAKEIDGKKVILPIWHEVDKKAVLIYSPTLADKIVLSTSKLSIRQIAMQLASVLVDK